MNLQKLFTKLFKICAKLWFIPKKNSKKKCIKRANLRLFIINKRQDPSSFSSLFL